MREAIVEGQLVLAGPDAPEEAACPVCGGAVRKRKRRTMDGQVAYFYRHEAGAGEEFPLRYHPYLTPILPVVEQSPLAPLSFLL